MLPANRKNLPIQDFLPSLLLNNSPLDDFTRAMDWVASGGSQQGFLATDVVEHADCYELYVDIPGVSKEEVEVSLEDTLLSITVKRSKTISEGDSSVVHSGRWEGSTTKSLKLPHAYSEEEVEAKLNDGVLFIKIAKQPEKQAKRITVK